jgi:hypothetical protein
MFKRSSTDKETEIIQRKEEKEKPNKNSLEKPTKKKDDKPRILFS